MGAVGISEQVPSGTTSNHHLLKQDSLNSVSPKMATFASCYREVQIWKGNLKKKHGQTILLKFGVLVEVNLWRICSKERICK